MDASALASAESWLSIIGSAKLAATFLVALGVAIEFGGDWISRPFERVVKEAREKEVVELRHDTATANERAANAELELAKLKAPRLLSAEQQAIFTRELRPFAGTTFRIVTYTGLAEPLALSEQIAAALIAAGWTRQPIPDQLLSANAGVIVAPINDATSEEDRAVDALVSALNVADIKAARGVSEAQGNPKRAAVKITVAAKP
jgi:hypothetical protein